nr:MAG TPA: hypothetical protein [Caudoviricetes sp.]
MAISSFVVSVNQVTSFLLISNHIIIIACC